METMTEYQQQIKNLVRRKRLEHNTLQFAGFMRERHEIWIRKQKGLPSPWTTDPVLSAYRFCNVYRELDTVTIWVRENIREPFAEHPNLWFMLCAARQINHPDTLAELIADKKAWPTMNLASWNPERMREIMNARKARKQQVYTGAYMLTNILDKTDPNHPHDKPWFTAHKCLGSLVPLRKEILDAVEISMEATHAQLRAGYGWGGFLAYEVCCDMRWTRYGEKWKDKQTFAYAGPGAVRGLNRIHKRPYDARMTEVECKQEMSDLLAAMRKDWPKGKAYPKLEMREIEHTLCEFDKHQRVVLGQGRPRSIYRPRATEEQS